MPGISLPSLLRKHNVTSIDIFQVDAEGYVCVCVCVHKHARARARTHTHTLQVDAEGSDGRIVMQLDLRLYRPMVRVWV